MGLIQVKHPIERQSDKGRFWYTDPIIGEPVGAFDSVSAREDHIKQHYLEPARCVHDWEELTRVACRADPGMVSGSQRCLRCGTTTHYTKDENE